jgi:hypothetical protein
MFKRKQPLIEFASEADFHDLPKPSKFSIPSWYKGAPNLLEGDALKLTTGIQTQMMKRCVPFLDSMITGYTVELWSDVVVGRNENGTPNFEWRISNPPIEMRPTLTSEELPVPAGHNIDRLTWISPYYFRLPAGYSFLVSHPFNRFDLPFTTLSAVVDADGIMGAGNVPFFIKDGFEGVIKKGTPIYQVLPFKREVWNSKETPELIALGQKNNRKSYAVVTGFYRNNIWKRKDYR